MGLLTAIAIVTVVTVTSVGVLVVRAGRPAKLDCGDLDTLRDLFHEGR